MAMFNYRNVCDRCDCRANLAVTVDKVPGHYCDALWDTRDYQKGEKVCPFFKTIAQYEKERAELKARGHIIDRMDTKGLTTKPESDTLDSGEVMDDVSLSKLWRAIDKAWGR